MKRLLLLLGAFVLLTAGPMTAPSPRALRITKTCPSSAGPGDLVTCSYTVTNIYASDGVSNLRVTQTVPYPGGTSTLVDCKLWDGSVTTDLGSFGSTDGMGHPMDSCSNTVDETMPAGCSGTYNDLISALGDAADASCTDCASGFDAASIAQQTCTPTPAGTATPTPTPTPPATARLIVSKICPEHNPGAGAQYTCNFSVQNRSPSNVDSLVVTDTAPAPGGTPVTISCIQGGVATATLGPFGGTFDTCTGSISLTNDACTTGPAYLRFDEIDASGTDLDLGITITGFSRDYVIVPNCATPTGTPPTSTPTLTPTPTVTGTPPTATPTVTGTPPTATVTPVIGTPTPTPVAALCGGALSVSVVGVSTGGRNQRLPYGVSASGGTAPYTFAWSCNFDRFRPVFVAGGAGTTSRINCSYPNTGNFIVEARAIDATGKRGLCGINVAISDIPCCTPIPTFGPTVTGTPPTVTATPTITPTRTPTPTGTPTITPGGPTLTPTRTPTVTPTVLGTACNVTTSGIVSVGGVPPVYNGRYVMQKTDFGFLWLDTGSGSLGPNVCGHVQVESKCGVGQPSASTNIYVLGDCNGITNISSSGSIVQAQQFSGQCGAASDGCGGPRVDGTGMFDFTLGTWAYTGRDSTLLPGSGQSADLVGRHWRVIQNNLTSFTWVTP